jgi:hypothetical protein
MPNDNGTLALTSDLGAYLPLTGGTLTGALNGTSATFTSSVTAASGTFITSGTTGTTELLRLSRNASGFGFTAFKQSYNSTFFLNGKTLSLANDAGIDFAHFAGNNAGTITNFILPNGNMGIGTTSPDVFAGYRNLSVEGGSGGIYSSKNSTGTFHGFFGVDQGESGVKLYSFTNHALLLGTNNTERMRITSDGFARLSASSGGIQFNGDTAAANALDDYEEGTWTPTLIGATTSGTVTYVIRVGKYTKIGNLVTVQCYVSWNSGTGGVGAIRITGLPFTAVNNTNQFYFSGAFQSGITTMPLNSVVYGAIGPNTSYIGVDNYITGGGVASNTSWNAIGLFGLTISYMTA